ncbi:MAG: cation-translocating P-type ATPase [Gemmataceae bacterium]
MSNWHQLTTEEALEKQKSDPRGLAQAEWQKRFQEHGPNELKEAPGRGPWRILWEQLSGALVILLMVAAVVSLLLDEYTDAIVILAIVILNAVLGFVQDYRAEQALAALKKLAVPHVRVRRDGAVREISARELVPGDVVLLETGNHVPADCRILESVNLRIQEAALTGESEAVEKTSARLEGDKIPLGDRRNMAFMGTMVSYGHGPCLVTETGMDTELGHIAHSLQTVESEPTPLQQRLAQLGRTLAFVALGIVAVVFVMGLMRGEDLKLMLMTAMSLAVAVVPEGLPAVATVALALGARRMFQRHALIRKLPAVETLGSVTVICSDKTGTLTENRMTVTVLDVAGDRLELTESLRRGKASKGNGDGPAPEELRRQASDKPAFALLLAVAGLCNDVELQEGETDDDENKAVGDPTENALALAAAQLGLHKDRLDKLFPRVGEVAFDSERKRMSTLHRIEGDASGARANGLAPILEQKGKHVAFTKGAVDSLLHVCDRVWDGNEPHPIDNGWRERIHKANESLAANGMRVLGAAFRIFDELPAQNAETAETGLTFLGLSGIIDPPRPEVAEAVARCHTAGIRVVMITGDHPITAKTIAAELDVVKDAHVVTGQELEEKSAQDLANLVKDVSVFARVAPKHKLQLVQALQQNGEVVSMTGDGVNDAPALKQAHIGVAMGLAGTDVAKEASQMVLLDDNFATIVNAVEEGRVVYDNIRKFVRYTMTSNTGEVWVMVLGPLVGMPLALLPLQILWINLVTDGLPGLALSVEQAERDTMRRPPYPPSEHIFGRRMGWDIAWIGLLMGVVSLAMGYWYWLDGANETRWRTIVFTVLTLSQMGNAMAIRSSHDSLFKIGVFSNRFLIFSVLLTFGLQMMLVYVPFFQDVFKTTALTAFEMIWCLALSTVVFWAVEAQKWWLRRNDPESSARGAIAP